jgi:DNA mismatch endonuclease (patch repair protein)
VTDIVDKQTRSRMMSGIRGKNTGPELALRREMHARGFRYRLHAKDVPGRPDLVLPKYRAVVFVHGCFWHRHAECRFTTTPSTRAEFWGDKFARNISRDQRVHDTLTNAGWRLATVWECALRKSYHVERAVDLIAAWLVSGDVEFEIGETDVRDAGPDDGQSAQQGRQSDACRK